ncbi:MAG: type II secretion system protein GspD [Planctomycetota bacterium]|jgi:type II secretory pathway component GspD/PulD (secretin)
MARKNIGRILSGGAIIFCIVVLCALDIDVQAFEGARVTYTISGSVTLSDGSGGLDGVTMKGLPNDPVTGIDGSYSATVEYGWGGRVIPQKDGYTFEPASKPYSKVTGNLSNEDYTAAVRTYTISGTVDGMEGVVMNGLPGDPVTGTNGTYSVTVEYGWSGTVIPEKEGYAFTPNSKPYNTVNRDLTNQNYRPALITFTISGSADVQGVVMNGLPGNPVTGRNGTYSASVNYGFSGTVTPRKEGYTFEPAERQYTELFSAQPNEDYTATVMTYTISGTADIDGVEMRGLPGNPVTDATGYYSASVDYGFTGRVTPTKEGYSFKPASKTYSKVTSDKSGDDYAATVKMLTITGTTGREGVVMNGLPGNPVTGRTGTYKVTVEYGWSGTVIPEKEGYTFSPDSKPYGYITADQTNQNYTSTEITYTISGSVGEQGIVMNGLPGNPVSDAAGIYRAIVKYGFSGSITPRREGYSFEPPKRQYDDVISDLANEDYTATLAQHIISGAIISDRGPVEDAFMVADMGGGSATTDASGRYELPVDYGWKGTITPTKEGYTFAPVNKRYPSVTRDQTNQGYNAKVLTFTISGSVIIGGTPVDGVLVTASEGGGSDTTDNKGKWTVTVPYGWTGEITPSKEGFVFNPPSEPYTNVTTNYRNGAPETLGRRRAPAQRPTSPPPERVPTVPPPERVPTVPPPERVPTVPPPESVPTVSRVAPPEEAGPPKTPLEAQIDKIQTQLADLLAQAAGEAAPTAPAIEGPIAPGEVLITNTFVDNDLPTEVLQTIASQAGIAIIPDETVVGTVTCDLREVPLDTALEIVLAGTPYVVKKTPYYYLVCSGGINDAMFPVVSETRNIKLNYIAADAAVALLSTAFRQYTQGETNTHTVSVTAPPTLMNRIVEDLKRMDLPPRHVLLDARIVIMERGDLLNLGVEWGWPQIKAGLFGNDLFGLGAGTLSDFGGKSPWGISIGYTPDATFTGSLELTLNLLAENGEATIVSKPQVLAQDGRQSQIQVLTEEYYMMTAAESGTFGYARSELEQVTSGTTLTITPRIGDNNDITLDVAVEVSDSIPRGRGSDLPVVTRRTASNVVRIKDGGTVALAGLTENRTNLKRKRVPGLSRIPILGHLFKNSDTDEFSREIAVFVTAHLVSETGRPINFGGPSSGARRAPTRPQMGGEQGFRMQLRESLSRF